MALLEREWKRIVSAKRDLIVAEFHAKLDLFDKKIREGLDFEQPPVELQKSVGETSAIVADLEVLAQGELAELKPLTADLTRYGLLKTKFAEIEQKVNEAGSVMTASREADGLEDYLKVIREVGDTGVLAGTQKLAHMNMLVKLRDEGSILKEILTAGNLSLWTRLNERSFSGQGYPATLEGEELVRFLSLRDDENLGEMHRYPVTENDRERWIYSLGGEMTIRVSKVGDVEVTEAEGAKVFDPQRLVGTEVVFAPMKFIKRKSPVGGSGILVGEGVRCPESTLTNKVRLASFVDSAVANYRDSLLKSVDRILESGVDVSPLY
jgi:hypothetical protein